MKRGERDEAWLRQHIETHGMTLREVMFYHGGVPSTLSRAAK